MKGKHLILLLLIIIFSVQIVSATCGANYSLKCETGVVCSTNSDCLSGVCSPIQIQNMGSESQLSNNSNNSIMLIGTQLVNATINQTKVCVEASCFDGIQNNDEAGIDCGGGCGVCLNPCPIGDYLDGSVCRLCPSGTYSSRYMRVLGIEQCTPCPTGTFSYEYITDHCEYCGSGMTSEEGATQCSPCPANTFSLGRLRIGSEDRCMPCHEGTYSQIGASYCMPLADWVDHCPNGTIFDIHTSLCVESDCTQEQGVNCHEVNNTENPCANINGYNARIRGLCEARNGQLNELLTAQNCTSYTCSFDDSLNNNLLSDSNVSCHSREENNEEITQCNEIGYLARIDFNQGCRVVICIPPEGIVNVSCEINNTDCVARGDVEDSFIEPVTEVPSMTNLLKIALVLDSLNVELDKLANQVSSIASYYESTGAEDSAGRYYRIQDMLKTAHSEISEIKNNIRSNLDSITLTDMELIKQDIKQIKNVVLKDIVYLILSEDEGLDFSKESKKIIECDADYTCFEDALRICRKASFAPDGKAGAVLEIVGLNDDTCEVYGNLDEFLVPEEIIEKARIKPPLEMTCKIKDYALGLNNRDKEEEFIELCEGNLVTIIKSLKEDESEGYDCYAECDGGCANKCGRFDRGCLETCFRECDKYCEEEFSDNSDGSGECIPCGKDEVGCDVVCDEPENEDDGPGYTAQEKEDKDRLQEEERLADEEERMWLEEQERLQEEKEKMKILEEEEQNEKN